MSEQQNTTKPVTDGFGHRDVDVQERRFVYRGFFKMEKLRLRHRLFAGGWSRFFERELFVRGQAVAAIAYDPKSQHIGLIEQFRIGALDGEQSPWLYEVVAGMTEAGETPEAVILRELKEEANISPVRLIPICHYLSSPGGTDESLVLYCALADLSQAGGIYGLEQENEDIRVHVLPQQQVFDGLYSGKYANAATLICLQWLQLQYETLIETPS